MPVEVALEDHAELSVRFAGGASGSATVMALSPGNPNALSLSVDGSEGGFDWQQEEPSHFVERRLGMRIRRERDPARLAPADRWMAVTPAGHPDGYLDAFRNVIAECWHAMREGGDAYPSFADGAARDRHRRGRDQERPPAPPRAGLAARRPVTGPLTAAPPGFIRRRQDPGRPGRWRGCRAGRRAPW